MSNRPTVSLIFSVYLLLYLLPISLSEHNKLIPRFHSPSKSMGISTAITTVLLAYHTPCLAASFRNSNKPCYCVFCTGFMIEKSKYESISENIQEQFPQLNFFFYEDKSSMNEPKSIESAAADLVCSLENHGWKSDCDVIVIGHSRGGTIAVEASCNFFKRGVKALLLIDPVDDPSLTGISSIEKTPNLNIPIAIISTPVSLSLRPLT